MAARVVSQEEKRLQALHEAKLIDTPIHHFFERMVELMLNIFNTPIAAISLIDEQRQWFKAIRGCNLSETQRETSFCTHTIMNEDVMVINDAQNDPVFKNNPLVTGELAIRFYAGHPIHAKNLQPIGAICLLDQKPRLFTEREKLILKDLVQLIDAEIKNIARQEDYQLICEATPNTSDYVDKTTRLWNASGMNVLLNRYIDSAESGHADFGLINLSVDCFNTFSMENGQEAANELLLNIAKALVQILDLKDIAGYWGGKEFMIIISSPSKEKIKHISRQILAKSHQEGFNIQARKFKTTFSMGSVTYNKKKHTSLKSLLNDVHKALEECRCGSEHIVLH